MTFLTYEKEKDSNFKSKNLSNNFLTKQFGLMTFMGYK